MMSITADQEIPARPVLLTLRMSRQRRGSAEQWNSSLNQRDAKVLYHAMGHSITGTCPLLIPPLSILLGSRL